MSRRRRDPFARVPASPVVATVGECMIEVRRVDGVRAAIGFGGDALNTAVYLARASPSTTVRFVTAVGDDVESLALVERWREERVDVSRVRVVAGATSGLYVIHTDAAGERAFTYYRSHSAARSLFRTDEDVRALDDADLIFLSAISLSLLDEAAHRRLLDSLDRRRLEGAVVAFDTNFREAGWESGVEVARSRIDDALRRTDIALPTLDDESRLAGRHADPELVVRRFHDLGVDEVALKLSAAGSVVSDGSTTTTVPVPGVRQVDTTGAGDAYDGAYLAARLAGHAPPAAATAANAWGAAVVAHHGAIVERSALPEVRT